jgi:hypothetical protein
MLTSFKCLVCKGIAIFKVMEMGVMQYIHLAGVWILMLFNVKGPCDYGGESDLSQFVSISQLKLWEYLTLSEISLMT